MKWLYDQPVDQGRYVRIHYNPKRKAFTVIDPNTKRVLSHLPAVRLSTARFIVYDKRRQQVRSTKKDVVHAYIEGRFVDNTPVVNGLNCAAYNPYFNVTFIDKVTKQQLTGIYPEVVCAGKEYYYRTAKEATVSAPGNLCQPAKVESGSESPGAEGDPDQIVQLAD